MYIYVCGMYMGLDYSLRYTGFIGCYIPPEMSIVILITDISYLKGISAEFQVIRGFSQKIPADLLSYDKIHS